MIKDLTKEQKNILFKEQFMTFHLIGTILIVAGIILSTKGSKA